MKQKKLSAYFLAAVTVLAPLSLQSPVFSPAYAADMQAAVTLPGWIPADLDSVLEFRNTYGATHIEDGLLCVVFLEDPIQENPRNPSGGLRYDIVTSGDAMKKVQSHKYGNDTVWAHYEVVVYKPQQQGEFSVSLIDTWQDSSSADGGNVDCRYTFEVDEELQVTETDVYSWLPDSEAEFNLFSHGQSGVTVKDNYVVFCLEFTAGTPYIWIETERSYSEYFENCLSYDCTAEGELPLDGGSCSRVIVYQAVKDGYAKLEWGFGAVNTTGEIEKTLTADCVILDDAQTVLTAGKARVALEDYDTGALLSLDGTEPPSLWTSATYQTPQGPVSTGPIVEIEKNPAVVSDIAVFFGADSFSFGLLESGLPDGYVLPDNGAYSAGYFSGTIVPDDYMTMTKFDNGAADIVFRLKKDGSQELAPNETRVTLLDYETGSPLIIDPDMGIGFSRTRTAPNHSSSTEMYQLGANPCTLANLSEISKDAFGYSISTPDYYTVQEDSVTVRQNANGSFDVKIRLKFNPTCDITGDGRFNTDDIQRMQKWLLRYADAKPTGWKAADCNNDNTLDARDLTLMKRSLTAPAAYTDTSYGVFLGIEPEDIARTLDYDTIVIDAQYFTKEQIAELHASGHTVYSYINIGSVEDFRPYYNDYLPYTIGDYENWDEERWVDVSKDVWKEFILEQLAPEILAKGVDGLFVDNTDVYYIKHTKAIYQGVTDILKGLQALDTYVSINGGDTFVMEYLEKGGRFSDIADAVNQETVFSKIEWEEDRFSRNDDEERAYFQEYVETVAANGGDIYLLEYTKDAELIEQIKAYCREHHFRYYVSGTLELL